MTPIYPRCGHPKTDENSRMKKDGCGRYYPQCRTCYRATEQRRKLKRRMERDHNGKAFASTQPSAREKAVTFPIEPLLAVVRRHTHLTKAQEQAVKRAKDNKRLTLLAADKVAVALGTHPGLIWPEWWIADEMEESA